MRTASRQTSGPIPSPGRTVILRRIGKTQYLVVSKLELSETPTVIVRNRDRGWEKRLRNSAGLVFSMSRAHVTPRLRQQGEQVLIVDFLFVLCQLHKAQVERIQIRP